MGTCFPGGIDKVIKMKLPENFNSFKPGFLNYKSFLYKIYICQHRELIRVINLQSETKSSYYA